MPPVSKKPKPLIEYLKLEGAVMGQLSDLMLGIGDDMVGDLKKVHLSSKLGDEISALQIRNSRQIIRRAALNLTNGTGDIVKRGYSDAAALASKLVSAEEDTLLKLVYPGKTVKDLAMEESLRAAGAIETVMARLKMSQMPLSEQVYRTGLIARGQVDNYVNTALARGMSWGDFAKGARDLINPNIPGGVSYAAKRLARTEINNAFHAATVDRYMKSGIPGIKVIWNLSGSHPVPDECNQYAEEGPYEPWAVPKKPHPMCLCFITAELPSEDDFINSLFDDWDDEGDDEDLKPREKEIDFDNVPWASTKNIPKITHRQVTNVEKRALDFYTGNGYESINKVLRNPGKSDLDLGLFPSAVREVKEAVETLTKLLNSHETKEDLLLFRGTGFRSLGLSRVEDAPSLVGTVFNNDALLSTSFTERAGGTTESFPFKGPNKLNLRIFAPKGTKGLNIDEVSVFQGENEFLLPPGSKLRFVKIWEEETPGASIFWADVQLLQ